LLVRSGGAGQPLAVLFVDLDKFKEVNDVMGHAAGDQVLQAAAKLLTRCLPAPAELARWGGDEFVVAFPEIDAAETAIALATMLAESLNDPIDIKPGAVRIEVTIGIALFPMHGRTAEELIHAADLAMYASKEEKRSKIRMFDLSLNERVTERRLLERALREAIATEALSVVFQPIISTPNGVCEILEALVRWDHPKLGLIPPAEFIPLAERIGEINALGRWVLTKACREAASWPGLRPPSVSVNVSAIQMELGTLSADLSFALKEAGLPASRLQLEITESVFVGDHRNVISALAKLRETGIKISLDDFGTGFSCLAYLQRLPVDQLKIDKSFIDLIATGSAPIVKMILAADRSFRFKVVAEGVETEAQAQRLIGWGADYLQGYLFSKPLSPAAVREWLLAHPYVSLT
jgi:diguanylate cyclase (GGDEF)-like protein